MMINIVRPGMRSRLLRSLVGLWILSLNGCLSGHSPPTQFYLLESEEVLGGNASNSSRQVISLAPVRLAHYLDRPQIVTAQGDNRYQVSEYHRWAETLDHNIHRVLQQDLARQLPADVLSQPNADALQLQLTILLFHVDAQRQARLKAQWQLSRNKQLLKIGQGEYHELAATTDYPGMVAAMNVCLSKMTREMVADIGSLAH